MGGYIKGVWMDYFILAVATIIACAYLYFALFKTKVCGCKNCPGAKNNPNTSI